jgi:hypothetical protein
MQCNFKGTLDKVSTYPETCTFGQKESFQVVPQSDCDDRKVCGESEDREEAEEVVDNGQVPDLPLDGREVECVQVVQLAEGEHSRESKLLTMKFMAL